MQNHLPRRVLALAWLVVLHVDASPARTFARTSPTSFMEDLQQPATSTTIQRTSALAISMFSLYSVGILACLTCAMTLACLQNTPFVRTLSLPFLLVRLTGATIAYVSVLGSIATQDRWTCGIQHWCLHIGFSLFVQGTLPKCLRMRHEHLTRRSVVPRISDERLLIVSSPLTAINIIILLTWQQLDPLVPTVVMDSTTTNSTQTYHHECRSGSQTTETAFTAVLTTYNAILLILTIFVAQGSIPGVHQRERSCIACAFYVILACAVVIIALSHAKDVKFEDLTIVRLVLVFVATTVMFLLTVLGVLITAAESLRTSSSADTLEGAATTVLDCDIPDDKKPFEFKAEKLKGQNWEPRRVICDPKTQSITILDVSKKVSETIELGAGTSCLLGKTTIEIRSGARLSILRFDGNDPHISDGFLAFVSPPSFSMKSGTVAVVDCSSLNGTMASRTKTRASVGSGSRRVSFDAGVISSEVLKTRFGSNTETAGHQYDGGGTGRRVSFDSGQVFGNQRPSGESNDEEPREKESSRLSVPAQQRHRRSSNDVPHAVALDGDGNQPRSSRRVSFDAGVIIKTEVARRGSIEYERNKSSPR